MVLVESLHLIIVAHTLAHSSYTSLVFLSATVAKIIGFVVLDRLLEYDSGQFTVLLN